MNDRTHAAYTRLMQAARRVEASTHGDVTAGTFAADNEAADWELALAAQQLTAAVDALPVAKQPPGWGDADQRRHDRIGRMRVANDRARQSEPGS